MVESWDIPGGGCRGMDPKDGSGPCRAQHVGQSQDCWNLPGAQGTTPDPVVFSWRSQFLAFPVRVCPVRVPRSPPRSVCCHSRLFMLPRDSDGIKSFQDTRTAFPLFLLHPGAPWEGESQGKFWSREGEAAKDGSWNPAWIHIPAFPAHPNIPS